METLQITASQVKKGDKIFKVGAWNHHEGHQRTPHFYRDANGKGVYTPYDKDVYSLGEFTVHSCGKKRMYLMDENGMKGAEIGVKEDGNFWGYFTDTEEKAVKLISQINEQDKFKAYDFEIKRENFVS